MNKNKSGFSLVEVLLAIALFSVILSVLVGAFIFSQQSFAGNAKYNRALFLAREGLEISRNIRDGDFFNLENGTFGLTENGGVWGFAGSSQQIDEFTRTIKISEIDEKRKLLEASVFWSAGVFGNKNVSLRTILTYWQETVPYMGDWSNPAINSSLNLIDNRNGLKVQVTKEYAYVIRAGGDPDFVVIDITNLESPVVVGGVDLPGDPSDLTIGLDGQVFVTSNDKDSELQIVDVTNPLNPVLKSFYNADGNGSGEGIAFDQDRMVYFGRSKNNKIELLAIDISNVNNPSLTDQLEVSSDLNDITIVGDYLALATGDKNEELKIFNISDPNDISQSGGFDLDGNESASAIAGFEDFVVIGDVFGELTMLDISDGVNPVQRGSFDVGDDINDLSLGVDGEAVFVASNKNNADFQVIDLRDKDNPQLWGELDLSANLNGVAYSFDWDRAIVVGDDLSAEFLILMPQ